jgi:hypothetical protein
VLLFGGWKQKTKMKTALDLYHAEETCRHAHRLLGLKKAEHRATPADYRRTERAAKKLEQVRQCVPQPLPAWCRTQS